MEERDQFAMSALTGMLANPNIGAPHADDLAIAAYEVADAMLAQRTAASDSGASSD